MRDRFFGTSRAVGAGLAVLCLFLCARASNAAEQEPAPNGEESVESNDTDARSDADEEAAASKNPSASRLSDATAPDPVLPEYEAVVVGETPPKPTLPDYRATSEMSREEMNRRLPRSAPDALRYEPGVFVQQTAHSQGSAFIRGLTGQQTLILFDGIRLNNSTYRQGPNQYFFTLDSQSIDSIQVLRGGASTRYGSDALGGVILAAPIEPALTMDAGIDDTQWEPHLRLQGGTADNEAGGRAYLDLATGDSVGFFGGVGARRLGHLESGGIVASPTTGEAALVPRFEEDGRTQKGTGFDEMTADGRLVWRANANNTFKLASYLYRQLDAPRTDQCPAAHAPHDECLKYDEQFRTLVYGAWEGTPGLAGVQKFRATLSWQRQHERRTLRRPSARFRKTGRDTVDTFGVSVFGKSETIVAASFLRLDLRWGADTYQDRVSSDAWIRFTDVGNVQFLSRGQYLDGSTYWYGGVFGEGTLRLPRGLQLRAGGRLSWIAADAPGDPESGTAPVNEAWFPAVGHVGLEYHARAWLQLFANVDWSFRAPNLDDLTSRQQTGPGFQFENPDLAPETARTYEIGARVLGPVRADVWVFRTLLDSAVIKSPRQIEDCPENTQRCETSWDRFQLVNAASGSEVRGVEAALFALLPLGLTARATASWTWGESPNPAEPSSELSSPKSERLPLSRIPPLNGTLELLWRHPFGLSTGGALRWAAMQDRLALSDISDERIPAGGTPGFAVVDLRASYRASRRFLVSVVFENLFDAAYRYHGSSVNGPGRSLMAMIDFGPLWRGF